MMVAGALVSVGLVGGLFTARWGLSHLLVFLVVGMAAGVDGPLGLPFSEFSLAFGVGNMALAVILLDGGLRTPVATLKRAAAPALLLATVGVLLTTGLVAAVAVQWLGMDWRHGALLGAIVSSTDAAAVFSQLARSGVKLPEKLAATLEVESGLNDPLAVFLTLALIGTIGPGHGEGALASLAARQFGLAALIGPACGLGMAALLKRLPLADDHQGLTALLLTSSGVMLYGIAAFFDGSGLLAIYLYGIAVAHRAPRQVRPAMLALNGYTWLSEAVMFLLLGLLVTPHEVARFAVPGLVVAAALMLVARPVAVACCLTPLGVPWRQQLLVGWVGLRGAVPIVLALYPVLSGVPQAYLFFDLALVVVVCSMLLQSTTVGPLARRLGLAQRPGRPAAAQAGAAAAAAGIGATEAAAAACSSCAAAASLSTTAGGSRKG